MATGGIELPQIRPVGRPLKKANSINAGLGDSTKLVDINLSSSLMKRLPATISSTLGQQDEVVNEESSTRRRFSLQAQVKNKTTEKRQKFYKRLSSRNLMGVQSGAKSRTSDITSNLGNGKLGEKEERGRRQLTRSESFRLRAIKELAKQNSSLSDIYDDSAYLRRVRNFSDGTVDVVNTRAVTRSSLTKQISLLSLRSTGSTMSLMSLDTGEVRGRAERRKSRGSIAPSLRTRRGGRQGESPSRIGGRLSRRSQLKAIAPPPSVVSRLSHRDDQQKLA